MVKKIKQAVKEYQLHIYLIFTGIILLFRQIIRPDTDIIFYKFYDLSISIILFIIWLIGITVMIMIKHYYIKTKRSFISDKLKYRKSYMELLEFFQKADIHQFQTESFPIIKWYQSNGIPIGYDEKNRLISFDGFSEINIAVMGPPGSGKTTGICINSACTFHGSCLVIDIKGDIYNYVSKNRNRNIKRFCPENVTASYGFDPFSNISDMNLYERKIYISELANVIVPDEDGENNYFSSTARNILIGAIHLSLYNDKLVSFPEVIHKLLENDVFSLVKKSIESECSLSKEYLASLYGTNEKNVSGAYNHLIQKLIPFSNPVLDELLTNKNEKESISITDLENGTDIYLQINQENLNQYAPLFTLIIQKFFREFTKRPDNSIKKTKPILMILDEFPQLTFAYKDISMALSTLRSKNIICMLIQQNIAQIEKKYSNIGARALIGNCHLQIILGSNDYQSSLTYSNLIGTRKILQVSSSHGKTTSYSVTEGTEPIFKPEEIQDLQDELIFIYKGKYKKLKKLCCHTDKIDDTRI